MAMFWKICVVVILAVCSQVFAQMGKRGPMGGWSDVSENNQHVQNALMFAKDEYNKDRKEDYIVEISKIIRLKRQGTGTGTLFGSTSKLHFNGAAKNGDSTPCSVAQHKK